MPNLSLDGVEVLGASLQAIVDGFQEASTLARQILVAEGIGQPGLSGKVEIDTATWYPLDKALKAFQEIAKNVGAGMQYQIGLKIPENAVFPPTVTDIHSALQAVDIAYHMNHRKLGKSMFDPATGTKAEGIGHYRYEPVAGKRTEVLVVCDNPYPCDLDRGILTAMAKRFQPGSWVFHDESKPCRKKGGATCTYQVKWV